MTTGAPLHVYLIGDSDIERWPTPLLPIMPTVADSNNSSREKEACQNRASSHPPPPTVTVAGRSGATLPEVTAMARLTLTPTSPRSAAEEHHQRQPEGTTSSNPSMVEEVVVACAGENDIGGGKSVEATMDGFRDFLDAVLSTTTGGGPSAGGRRFLLFLGPKLEPWLNDDFASRKKYAKLSRAMRRACERHPASDRIVFLDCLTLFCGETATFPGALTGGKALPEDRFFGGDGLHLSDDGYRVWKGLVEDSIKSLGLANTSEDAAIKDKK